MDQEVTVVCGFPRSGTSLMMRMLYAGGMDVFAESYASFEHDLVTTLPEDSDWMPACRGKAVKILDPHHHRPPRSLAYRFIWMDRDCFQQARSQVKFMKAIGVPVVGTMAEIRRLEASMRRELPEALAMLAAYPAAEVIRVSFEALLANPLEVCRQLAERIPGLDAAIMAQQVKPRPATCLPYMLELEVLAEVERKGRVGK